MKDARLATISTDALLKNSFGKRRIPHRQSSVSDASSTTSKLVMVDPKVEVAAFDADAKKGLTSLLAAAPLLENVTSIYLLNATL